VTRAINLVEVFVTLYLLAIIGALAYAAFNAWVTRRGTTHFFSTRPHDVPPPTDEPSAHTRPTIST